MFIFDNIKVSNNTSKEINFNKVLCKKRYGLFFRELINIVVLGSDFMIGNEIFIKENIASAC